VCARRRSNFLLAAKRKSPKRRRPPVCVPRSPYRANGGNLRCSVLGWCRRTHCVLPSGELRSNSCGKPDHEVRVSFGTRTHPSPCASRRSQQGWGAGTKTAAAAQLRLGSGTRCALPTFGARPPWRAERSEGPQAERSNGPSGARSHPLLTVPRSAGPGVSASRRTRASLSGLPQLFERSSKNVASSAAHPRPEHRRLPPCPRQGGHGQRGRLSFGYFSLAKQRTSTSAAGPRPGLRPQPTRRSNHRDRTPKHSSKRSLTAYAHPLPPPATPPTSHDER
jgi:hypothetical protein